MIVFCHLLNDNSGSPVVLRSTIEVLSQGDECVLFVGSQGRGLLEASGIPIHRYWYKRSRHRLITLFTYMASQLSLYRALSHANIASDAIIYVNTLLPFGAALWASRNNRPVIYHLHEISITPGLLRKFLVNIASKTASHFFYVSEDHRKRLPIEGAPSQVLANPVSPQIADQGFKTPYTPRRSGVFEVLMLASPRDFKGVPEFISLARSFAQREDVSFTLVLNATEDEIATYLRGTDCPANLHIHPRTQNPSQFYSKADVLLNLSRVDEWIETFGLTIVEGMVFGLPAIVPPVGGPAEIVTEGREGFLVDSHDESALKEKLSMLIDDPSLTLEMSIAARKRAGDFTQENYSQSLRTCLQSIREGYYDRGTT